MNTSWFIRSNYKKTGSVIMMVAVWFTRLDSPQAQQIIHKFTLNANKVIDINYLCLYPMNCRS